MLAILAVDFRRFEIMKPWPSQATFFLHELERCHKKAQSTPLLNYFFPVIRAKHNLDWTECMNVRITKDINKLPLFVYV